MTLDPVVAMNGAVALCAFCLLVAGAWQFWALFQGASELRRLLRSATGDYSDVLLKSPLAPPVSVVVRAREATPTSRALVRRLLDLHFGTHEVVLVLDGPTDTALAQWVEEFRLVATERTESLELPAGQVRGFLESSEPMKLLVVETSPCGEAKSLNAGVNAARYRVIGLVDSRAEFEPGWMLRLVRTLLEGWDEISAVASAGLAAPADRIAGRVGGLEALRRWLVRGAAYARWGRVLPLPGGCLLVKRESVIAVGGFRANAVALFQDLHRKGLKAEFVPAMVSWWTPPKTMAQVREQTGYDQAVMARGPGRVLLPLLETVGLLLAGAGVAMRWVPPSLAGLMVLASAGTGMVVSGAAVVFREMADPGKFDASHLSGLFLTAVWENLGYRQIRNLWVLAVCALGRAKHA